jgi:hypothetical protein
MQDIAGLALKPADLIAATMARNESESGWNIAVEGQYSQLVSLQHLGVMEKG